MVNCRWPKTTSDQKLACYKKMAPIKEYSNNFAPLSMPIDVYADVVPQVDIAYQIKKN